jgi:phosphoenolpyruvate-protein kinase (PTS system EI component)
MALTTSLHPERYDLLQQQLRSLLRANAFGGPEVRLGMHYQEHILPQPKR